MNPAQRRIKFPLHLMKRQRQRRAPPDQHVIVAVAHFAASREPHDFSQPAPHPIALHRIADLPRHRKADADAAFVTAGSGLQHETAERCPRSARSSAKIGPARQPLHGNGGERIPITH